MATDDRDERNEASYTEGFRKGYRMALEDIYANLEAISDDDGSLSGGDCVEYIYGLFATHGIGNDEAPLSVPTGDVAVFFDDDDGIDKLTGQRDDLLLLARNIHDALEGEDQP